jgi:hypothetical protein
VLVRAAQPNEIVAEIARIPTFPRRRGRSGLQHACLQSANGPYNAAYHLGHFVRMRRQHQTVAVAAAT